MNPEHNSKRRIAVICVVLSISLYILLSWNIPIEWSNVQKVPFMSNQSFRVNVKSVIPQLSVAKALNIDPGREVNAFNNKTKPTMAIYELQVDNNTTADHNADYPSLRVQNTYLEVQPQFQLVHGEEDIWAYSAFYEYSNPSNHKPGLRVICIFSTDPDHYGMIRKIVRRLVMPTFHLIYQNGTTDRLPGRFDRLAFDGRKHRQLGVMWAGVHYHELILECDLEPHQKPTYVAFSWPSNETLSENIRISYPDLTYKRRITTCYAVFFGNYDNVNRLQSNIEYDLTMGSEHIYLYNMSVGPDVDKMLRFYVERGVLTVLPMEHKFAHQMYYQGQQIALTDCHTRNRYTSTFVALHDSDEYFLPTQHSSWPELLNHLEQNYKNRNESADPIAAFSFQHALYDKNPPNDSQWSQIQHDLSLTDNLMNFIKKYKVELFLEMTKGHFWGFPRRQKTIFRPDLVIHPGTHYAEVRVANTTDLKVNNTLAHLAHHRHLHEQGTFHVHPQPFYQRYLKRFRQARKDLFCKYTKFRLRCEKLKRKQNLT